MSEGLNDVFDRLFISLRCEAVRRRVEIVFRLIVK